MPFAELQKSRLKNGDVAVVLSHSRMGQGHAGLAYYDENQELRILHLSWHHDLKNELVSQVKECWVANSLKLKPYSLKRLHAYVMLVAKQNKLVNYGIDFSGIKNSFDPAGRYSPPKDSDGLTCATFPLAVMFGCAVFPINLETWPATEENRKWGEFVCRYLTETPTVTADHVESVRNHIQGLRLTPYELGGASLVNVKDWPASYNKVSPFAQVSKDQLGKSCPWPFIHSARREPQVAAMPKAAARQA
ncbi:hypothetical protein [Herbaspirillum robiniae]|uniref:hypothetical protein n=1 Tax=Herbaspirillum robiniae TaxID=2014887 RepID=UPI0011E4CF03|nr:hypothetical protein [Herbaspirillum robiniae]